MVKISLPSLPALRWKQDSELEKKLRQSAMASGIVVYGIAAAVSYNVGKDYFEAGERAKGMLMASVSGMPLSVAAKALLAFGGFSYAKEYVPKALKSVHSGITKTYREVMDWKGYLQSKP